MIKISYTIFCVFVSVIFLSSACHAQQFKLSQGLSFTQFKYQNNQGQQIQGLRQGSGLSVQLSYHKASLVDSSTYKVEQSRSAIYLNQHPKLGKLLSLINYDLGIQFMQMNAVGDIQNNAFNYQTDYLGLHGKLGIRIPLPYAYSLNFQGIASVNKIVNGNLLLVNHYVDLTEDQQFAQVKIMAGYAVEIEKKFTNKLATFISYQQSSTINESPVGLSILHFKPTVFSVGIRFIN